MSERTNPGGTDKHTLQIVLSQADKQAARIDRLIERQEAQDTQRSEQMQAMLTLLTRSLVVVILLLVAVLAGVVGVYVTLPDGTTTSAASSAGSP